MLSLIRFQSIIYTERLMYMCYSFKMDCNLDLLSFIMSFNKKRRCFLCCSNDTGKAKTGKAKTGKINKNRL